MEESLCHIEIVKDGKLYIARVHLQATVKEYKNQILEDMLTELVIDLQEEFGE
ncbi:MAG: hypothetical protein PHH26_04230 [Candidatus Thermoplasmatota archaeon]|jgi:hypothetical protein|nr:hypothetical protein [Candidatus Thermoplasmatota archaeon]